MLESQVYSSDLH